MTELENPKLFDLTDDDLLDKIASNIPVIQGENNNMKMNYHIFMRDITLHV